MPTPLKFILADTHDLARLGVGVLIRRRYADADIADAGCYDRLVDTLRHWPESVVILDYARFDIPSVERLLILISRFDMAGWIILSDEIAPAMIRRLSGEPTVSFAHKWDRAEDIAEAIGAAARRRHFRSESVARSIAEADNRMQIPLTDTEKEILTMISHGKTAKEIAACRCSSIHTIVTHKKNIFRKIGVSTVYEATRYAMRAGLADPIEYYL